MSKSAAVNESTSGVPVDGVAVTAIGVAVIRARESAREDRLYDDPVARHFVDAARSGFDAGRWARLEELAEQFYEGRTVGVHLVDERVRAAVEAGIHQIVFLGAGLDTRAFRMELPADVVIFEIDLPELFEFKERVLAREGLGPRCRRKVIIADLSKEWRKLLLDNGFDADQPTLWVDEGALGYLTKEWNQRVVRTLTELSAPGSRFGAGRYIADPDDPRYRELHRFVGNEATGSHTAAPDFDVEQWLRGIGWNTEFHSWNDQVARLDRQVQTQDPRVGNISAVRR
ncbi:MAG: SAM-dependent methyltransferase [Nocardia sp.]|nr:SAM-dependent methyltransferase [Nocardia sp.]